MPAAVVQTAPRASPQTLATRGPFTVSVILSVTECRLLGGLEPAGSAAGSSRSETCPPSSPRLPRLPRRSPGGGHRVRSRVWAIMNTAAVTAPLRGALCGPQGKY